MDHPQTKGRTRMVEPMRPDPAEAVRPLLSAAQQIELCTMHSPHAMLSVRIGFATDSARHEEPLGKQLVRKAVWCCRGRPATIPDRQLSAYAGSTQIIVTSCKRRPFWAVIVIRSHD
jgi:hypothetical protein